MPNLSAIRGGKTSQDFLISGSFVVPAGVTSIDVVMCGAGGGGAAGQNGNDGANDSGAGGGGGAGSPLQRFDSVKVTPLSTLTIFVPSGGAGGASNGAAGNHGGDATISGLPEIPSGILYAYGGKRGTAPTGGDGFNVASPARDGFEAFAAGDGHPGNANAPTAGTAALSYNTFFGGVITGAAAGVNGTFNGGGSSSAGGGGGGGSSSFGSGGAGGQGGCNASGGGGCGVGQPGIDAISTRYGAGGGGGGGGGEGGSHPGGTGGDGAGGFIRIIY